MSFVKLHSDYIMDGTTDLQNLFISEYMPKIPDIINKVYIYGLFLCSHSDNADNREESFAARLGIDAKSLEDAYLYLAELGLVQILKTTPAEVRYLPVKPAAVTHKYKPAEYADFNTRLQEIIVDRALTPNEFVQYYDFLENSHMDQDALLLIAKYATTLKDAKVGYSYVLTIARNWAGEGLLSVEQVEQRLLENDRVSVSLGAIFKALGSKKTPDFEDRQLYIKWTKGMEYEQDTLLAVAKSCKKGGTARMDAKLARFYGAKLFTLAEIAAYEANQDMLYGAARAITKKLGLYYEQLDNIVDTYVSVWLGLGFDAETLSFLADSCFKRGIRTLDRFDEKVNSFYRQGLVTTDAIAGKLTELSSSDALILEVLKASGSSETAVRSRDRDFYRTWTYAWNMPHELVLYAAGLATSAAQPLAYINRILGDYRAKGVSTVDAAKALTGGKASDASVYKKDEQRIFTHEYTSEQLNALIDDIDEVNF